MNISKSFHKPWYARKEAIALLLIALPVCYFLNFMEYEDPFSVPFCEPDGTCHEKPDKPSPRTVYSSWTKEQYDLWWKYNAELNKSAKEYTKKRKMSKKNKPSLVLLGDSITESWLGTGLGFEKERSKGIPEVLEEKFQNFDPVVLAISGDQTQHLLYRIQNGQFPSVDDDDAVFVVMIGTNNLGSGELPGPTSQGIIAVADYILKSIKGRLLLFHVLPRGDGRLVLPRLCPPRCDSSGEPFKSFAPAVDKLNEGVGKGVESFKEKYGSDRLRWMDCSASFIATDGDDEVDSSLMPDLLHPNAAGHKIMADCILQEIESLN
ncbi:unnamed protein product [Cylindrotheca closterium]|uniref:SGNH hydrolase-type esterase domain-containing protein n=1 Tax=Cylindrotheca closterium TaxID=2856 RepID=A0AAD2FQW0_9STRA|nr:unnamed protein product [Cylindrotheca closterium]